MGLYSHYTTPDLEALRQRLMDSLHARLTGPTSATSNGRSVQFQQQTDNIRKEADAVTAELNRRNGVVSHRPIYLV
jgi:hypothetical protein